VSDRDAGAADIDAVEGDLGAPAGRHEARERALHLLYEAEVKGLDPATVVAELVVPADPYTEELVLGVGRQLTEIDGRLEDASRGWSVARMPALDRAALRVACFELASRPDVPTAVVIDEAVRLVKEYSTDDSGRFVNGVLAAVAGRVRT
jgi:N utilization substance protein B